MKKKIIRPTAAEDTAITKAAMADPDSILFPDEEWEKARPTMVRGRGRPLGSGSKEQVTLRIDKDVLDFYKSKGEGWQTFINQVLGEIKKEAKSISAVEKKIIKGNLMNSKLKIAA
jgi:uncharacterized protein (DUF4415 family)